MRVPADADLYAILKHMALVEPRSRWEREW